MSSLNVMVKKPNNLGSQIQPLNKTAFSDYRSTCVKHLQTVWLIMAQFKAFTRGRLHPTLPLAEKRLWSSHSGKAQLSKKGKLVHGQWTSDESFFFKNIPNYRQIWADGPNKV